MLFDTLRRKNQAEQEEREWNANRPADYVSRNKDAMDSLTGQIGSGFDWDTGSKAYQQYRAQAQALPPARRTPRPTRRCWRAGMAAATPTAWQSRASSRR